MTQKIPFVVKIIIAGIGLIVFFFIVSAARNFLYPLLLAVLFAYLLLPVSIQLEKWRIPRPLGVVISILLGITIIGAILFFLYERLSFFVNDLPMLRLNAQVNLDAFQNKIESNFGFAVESQRRWIREAINQTFETGSGSVRRTFSATTTTIFAVGIMPVYVFFILHYRDKFRNFILMLTVKGRHEKTKLILDQISEVTQRYVGGVVTVVLILCVLNSLGLMVVGLKYPIMFGILSALMNLIPYFGTLIGGSLPLIFTLFSDTPEKALGVIILFVIIQFIENNILTPNITGGAVKINPFFTILGLVVSGMFWGIPGMLLVVPLLGTVKIIFENVEELHPYSYLMGTDGTRKYVKLERFIRARRKEKTAA